MASPASTAAASRQAQTIGARRSPASVEHQLATIKAHMPMTYADIQRRAREQGNQVFSVVRRACGGEANCFYAVEGGHVVGTPFALPVLNAELASLMVQFGCGFLIIWPDVLVAPVTPAAPSGHQQH